MKQMTDGEKDCLHIAPSDDEFTRKMRFHQSWYRNHVLGLPPGPNPSAGNQLYGNLLTDSDGRNGWNFLSESIHKAAEARLEMGGSVEPGRLRNNMLSSQPMCFNLFGPATDPNLATRLFRALPGLPEGLEIIRVAFEFAPDKSHHLDDNTAFDAFVEYRREGVQRGFIGIETKLTEPFSQQHYDFNNRYSRWQDHPKWWWPKDSNMWFPNKQFNQLWRNHLLCFSMLNQEIPTFQEGFCAVVHHDDEPTCAPALTAYSKHLTPSGRATLIDWPLRDLIARWKDVLNSSAEREWLNSFQLRYLDLGVSSTAAERTNAPDWSERLDEAIEVFLKANRASISLLQMQMGMGYTRAAKLCEQMEKLGIVGPDKGTEIRDLLITRKL